MGGGETPHSQLPRDRDCTEKVRTERKVDFKSPGRRIRWNGKRQRSHCRGGTINRGTDTSQTVGVEMEWLGGDRAKGRLDRVGEEVGT